MQCLHNASDILTNDRANARQSRKSFDFPGRACVWNKASATPGLFCRSVICMDAGAAETI